jgi:hypothetical protein
MYQDMNADKVAYVRENAGESPWSDPLPDYTQPNGSYILEDCWFDIPATSMSRKANFYEGALAVLSLLSTPETIPEGDMVNLARKLAHEARHELRKMSKESTNF